MPGSAPHKPRARRNTLVSASVVILLSIAILLAFLQAGSWLVREDPLEPAKAIVILSGGLPERALAAAQIYSGGFAKEVWLTKPLQPSAAMQELQLPYAGEEEYSRMVLISKGVPNSAIRILQPKILNTADELHAVSGALGTQPAVVIVVTSKAHTRRVHALWNRILDTHRARLLVRAAPEDYFDPPHWWRTSNDALTVVREYLGLMNVWAGLPLHHTRLAKHCFRKIKISFF
jgi:uncharacterized SAM-binding protein YcdF (DUF218 family)